MGTDIHKEPDAGTYRGYLHTHRRSSWRMGAKKDEKLRKKKNGRQEKESLEKVYWVCVVLTLFDSMYVSSFLPCLKMKCYDSSSYMKRN